MSSPRAAGWQSIGNSWAGAVAVGGREMTALPMGPLQSGMVVMQLSYQGHLSEVAILGGKAPHGS